MRPPPQLWRCWALGVLLGLSMTHAHTRCLASPAQATPEQPSAPPRVELHVAGDPEGVELARETAVELFDRLGITVDVFGPDDDALELSGAPLAIANLELTPGSCTVVIIDGASGKQLEHRSLSADSLETEVEAALHVAYFVIEAMVRPKAEPPQAPKHTPAPEPPPPRARPTPPVRARPAAPPGHAPRVGFDAGVAFAATSLGASRVLAGGGLLAEVRWSARPLSVGGLLAASTFSSSGLEYGDASAFVRPSLFRALATLDLQQGSAVSFLAAVGPSLGWLRVVPKYDSPTVTTTPASSLFEPLVSATAGLRLRLWEQTFLSALGGVDISLAPQRFLAQVEGEHDVVLETPRLRPLLLIAASASLDSPARFEAGPEEAP